MVKKWLRDISFQKKMSLIFTVVCAFSTSVGGILYYQFAQREIVTNYKANAESLAVQLCYTLDARLQAVNRRAFAALTDTSFIQPLNDYMSAPDPKKEVILSGEAMYCLRDISLAEPLVHSTLVYTDKGIWSDFTRYRNWDFDYEKSAFGEIYQDSDAPAIQWLPTMQDEIFKDGDAVIPYVRRFSVSSGTSDYAYLIIQLDQQALLDELADDSNMVGEFLITDSSGNYIVSTAGVNAADLEKLEEMNRGQEASGYGGDLIYHGEEYLMYKGVVSINDWQIYILKSKAELLDSVGRLRMLIIWLSVVMIAICLLIVLFLSRQMTSSLQRLALQMNPNAQRRTGSTLLLPLQRRNRQPGKVLQLHGGSGRAIHEKAGRVYCSAQRGTRLCRASTKAEAQSRTAGTAGADQPAFLIQHTEHDHMAGI